MYFVVQECSKLVLKEGTNYTWKTIAVLFSHQLEFIQAKHLIYVSEEASSVRLTY
jgi:hypothetical protein